MIRLLDNLENISEPYMGSEILSLYNSFNKQTQRLCLYENDEGAVLLRFDERLLISGRTDLKEAKALCRMFGLKRIEVLKKDMSFIPHRSYYHSIMEWERDEICEKSPKQAENMKVPFEILKKSDTIFNDVSLYDYWLSDVRSLERTGSMSVFVKGEDATASVGARGFGKSLISQVATVPEMRGKGLASELLREVCALEKAKGNTPFLVSKDRKTDSFYKSLGFMKRETKVLIYL